MGKNRRKNVWTKRIQDMYLDKSYLDLLKKMVPFHPKNLPSLAESLQIFSVDPAMISIFSCGVYAGLSDNYFSCTSLQPRKLNSSPLKKQAFPIWDSVTFFNCYVKFRLLKSYVKKIREKI